ncbi:DUF6308 family protein [Mycolicibacterium llatzerense]|uniref:DUF6308 family protein n=1 Tax=Mycolicibacterium llatzerense TaxID=280871 RepID=UPI0008DE0962|nr:DUF6308 family protein [Mycolicibacterium llatzerense]
MTAAQYVEWRQRWPRVVVCKDTVAAAALLQRYYKLNSFGVPNYSGAQFEAMAALNPDPHAIGPADFTAVTMLSVTVPAPAAIRLLGRDADEITDLLQQIPTDTDLVDIDAGELTTGSAVSRLWDVLRRGRDGLGRTKTSKLIAAKRPRLIPIWDSFVEQATGLDTTDYWRQFQRVLTVDDRSIWNWLTELRAHAPNVPANVSNLRILDVILWMAIDQSR